MSSFPSSHMADNSLSSNSIATSTYKLSKKEEGEVVTVDEDKLRCRRPLKDIINTELDSEYKELILALPKEERWLSPLRYYRGFWQLQQALPRILAMQEVFMSRPSDVIVTSFVKSGTTWLKALTFTIMHRDKYTFSHHPLLTLNPHDCVPSIEHVYAARDEQYLETLPSPRVLGSHLSYSLLPESIKTSKCPIVYICREPKDVFISFWHMSLRLEGLKEPPSFAQAFELFCEGRVPHELESSPEKILILKYEEMLKDPIDGVMMLANFIGHPFSEKEVKNGVVEKIVEFCSFNKLKELDVNNGGDITNSYFFRKAVVGDWQNYMTMEMVNKLDEITKEKLCGSSFTY
ncbi:hypothetical protein LUZ63_000492 [Rhynchospora breviuscula]|uniref:Sulfotransferase n=1 Tax=Rhynchospora breviuscula TaxID=2022672 RepID=A0A9Q0CVG5_9POAL|nr:hypothetical protein LUZ63_000492 [Rhynchospora breviuscula]